MGHIRGLYSFDVVFWDMSLDTKSLKFAKYALFAIVFGAHVCQHFVVIFDNWYQVFEGVNACITIIHSELNIY